MRDRRSSARAIPFPGGAGIFQRLYTRLGCQGRPPRFIVEFYPYANLTHTIRLREDVAYVRLSDVARRASLAVLEAAAAILLARLYRRRLPRQLAENYREFSLARATRARLDGIRRQRARRSPDTPEGRHHNLVLLYSELNREYFGGRLPRPALSPPAANEGPRLGWSQRPWRRQLGIFDPALKQIVISSRLDRPGVPRFVLAYVLYHEMLHVKHPVRRARCGLQSHSADFRREERRFRDYARARRFLMRLA